MTSAHRSTLSRLAAALWLGLAGLPAAASAQNQGVVRDGTLGNATAGVVAPGPDDLGQANYLIRADLGEQRGGNLFHSFKRFSIGSGERATFSADGAAEPGAIENVISRVTGDERSEIHGMLHSTIPDADLWLLNPKGVVFGAGAQLDVPGSFHASTGDYVDFGTDGLERFYSDLSRESVLSTATPRAFGFLSESGAAWLAVDRSALDVPDGETLELVGGDVSLTLGAVAAPGGDVRLEAQGRVGISQSLVDVNRTGEAPGTISIRGGKIVIEKSSLVRAENESSAPAQPGGSIEIEARNSVLVDASLLSVSTHGAGNAGAIDVASPEITLRQGLGFDPLAAPQEIRAGLRAETTSSGSGGEIWIRGEDVTLANGIGVSASAVGPAVSGKAGDVAIAARELKVTRNSHVSAETAGAGDGGTISIEAARSLVVDNSLLSVSTGSAGNAGTIHITGLDGDGPGPDVTIQNGTGYFHDFRDPSDPRNQPHRVEVGVSADTSDRGRGGVIEIEATSLKIQNGADVSARSVGGINGRTATGDAGDIDIDADSMEVLDRSSVDAGIFGRTEGDAGTIDIVLRDSLRVDAQHVVGSTQEPDAHPYAAIATWAYFDVAPGGSLPGAPGYISIKARSVELSGDAPISSECGECTSKAAGRLSDAATVRIEADTLRVGPGSRLSVATFADGDGGTITVDSDSVVVDSGGFISAQTGGAGDGGTITVDADSLVVDSGGFISAQTRGAGDGGTITVDADSVVVDSGGFISVQTEGTGNAGAITLDAESVLLRGGTNGPSLIDAGARGPAATGSGRTIDITTGTFVIERGGFVNAGSSLNARGNAGEVHVAATESIDISNEGGPRFSLKRDVLPRLPGDPPLPPSVFPTGIFSATVLGGNGGQITLDAPRIRIAHGAIVATSTIAGGNAGDILFGSRKRGDRILIEKGGVVDSTSFPARGRLTRGAAGNVTLQADESIEVIGGHPDYDDVSRVTSASLGEGAPGEVSLKAPRILVSEGGAIGTAAVPLESGGAGTSGGDIIIDDARELVVRGGGQIDASSFGQGDAGNITVVATRLIRVEGADSGIVSRTGASGDGGNVDLRAPRIDLVDGAEVSAQSAPGLGGVEVILSTLRDDGLLDGLLSEPPDATGDAGLVHLHGAEIIRLSGGQITTSAGETDGGNIKLEATKLVHLDAGVIEASVAGGDGGNITIDPEFVLLENGSRIVAKATGGSGGQIDIAAENYFAFPGSEVSAEADRPDLSGTVELHAPDVDLAGNLIELPTSYLDASSLMRERCAARASGESAGSFAVRGVGGIPPEPDGWLRAPVLPDTDAETAGATPALPILAASFQGSLLVARTCE